MTLVTDVESSFFSEQRSERVQYKRLSVSGSALEISVACGYRRSLDLDEGNCPGQDFVALYGGQGFVVGVLADGVSQSFFGDLAAREISKPLLDYLWERREQPPTQEEATQFLAELTGPVQEKVWSQPLSVPPESLLGKVLEEIRPHGTQTVFSAFIYAGETGRLDLYQVGDTLVWVYAGEDRPELIPVNSGRWSSTGIEHLSLARFRQSGVQGLLVHSDGLREQWAKRLENSDVPEEAFYEEVAERVGVDDLSFVSLELRREEASRPEPMPAPLPPAAEEPALRRAVDLAAFRPSRRGPSFHVVAAFLLGILLGTCLPCLWEIVGRRSVPW